MSEHALPNVSPRGYKLLAQNLHRGDVVELSYETNGSVKIETLVVAKANKGGIRLVRPNATRYPLVVVNCYGGNVSEKKGNGATDYSRSLGSNARIVRTGETAEVGTKRAGRIYTTDYEPDN